MAIAEPEPSSGSRVYYISLFGIVVALLNQIGYWSHFDINILEHATVWDVAKFSILPLATTGVAFVGMFSLGSVVSEFTDRNRTSTRWRVFGVALIALTSLAPMFLNDRAAIPTSFAIGGTVLLTGIMLHAGFDPFANYIRNRNTRDMALFLVIFLPAMSLAIGMQRAVRVEQGKAGQVARLPSDVLAAHGLTQLDSLRYLGATEDYTFLLIADKGVVLVLRADSFSGMSLSSIQRSDSASGRAQF